MYFSKFRLCLDQDILISLSRLKMIKAILLSGNIPLYVVYLIVVLLIFGFGAYHYPCTYKINACPHTQPCHPEVKLTAAPPIKTTQKDNSLVLEPKRPCDHKMRQQSVNSIRERYLISPNYSAPYRLLDMNREDFSQFQEVPALLKTYFNGKRNGFFIEAGAYNGETYSNTLQVEKMFNWTGLLVEPGTVFFNAIKFKNRKAHLLEGCLANICGIQNRSMIGGGAGASVVEVNQGAPNVTCFAIGDVLEAMHIKHVDWMILDTEDSEPEILMSFPWEAVTVDLIQIEAMNHLVPNYPKIKFFKTFLPTKGFEEQDSTKIDMLFRRKASSIPSQKYGVQFGFYVIP